MSFNEITVADVAEQCGVTRQTVYNWIRSGRLKSYGVKWATRIDRDSLANLLLERAAARTDAVSSADSSNEGVAAS